MPEPFELHLQRELESPYDVALDALRTGPERWLPGFARDGGRITAVVAFDPAGRRIGRRVEVTLGSVQPFAYGVTVRVEWQGAHQPWLYPRLEGHLRLERAEPGRCRLRFDARYVPPAGRVGASVDRAVMNRVADATVADFVDRTATLLTAETPV